MRARGDARLDRDRRDRARVRGAGRGIQHDGALLRSARARSACARQMDSLQHEVDSLAKVKKAVLADPAVQERIAREEFGMVRGDKEILYRFAEPDSARNSASKP